MSRLAILVLLVISSQQTFAAIALDRTRAVFNGSKDSFSFNIKNENKDLPYLAQAWIEDANGKKINSPFAVLPPLQRVEPSHKGQIKIQGLPTIHSLPQDRESLFYFNLREVPPRAEKQNTLQIALQTRIKLFYRPVSLAVVENAVPWQQKIELSTSGGKVEVNNPTPYYVVIIDAKSGVKEKTIAGFQPVIVPPKGHETLMTKGSLGSSPVITYIDDYGARPQMTFDCSGNSCHFVSEKRK